MPITGFYKKYGNICILLVFFSFLGVVSFLFFHNQPELLKDPEALKDTIESYGSRSVLFFIAFQILQVVFFIIPGEIFQIAGGYVFGPFYGFFLCLFGSVIGGSINFYVARFLGKKFVENLVTKKHNWLFNKINMFNNNQNFEVKASKTIFFLYLIPGMPKDLLGYVCGVTKIRYIHYIIFSNLGKIPALFLSTFFGGNICNLFSFFQFF